MLNNLKVERAILDLTQDQLAQKIGVSRQTINSIEKNRYVPSTVLALKLSAIFDKPVNEFFTLDDEDWKLMDGSQLKHREGPIHDRHSS